MCFLQQVEAVSKHLLRFKGGLFRRDQREADRKRERERERGTGLSQAADWRGVSATDVGEGRKLDQRVARATCVTHIVLKQHGQSEKGGKEGEKICSGDNVDQEVRFLSMQVHEIWVQSVKVGR